MRKLLFLSLAATYYFFNPACAQQQIEKPPEIENHNAKTLSLFKWDASIDAYHLLRSGSKSILIRYSANRKSAFRFRLSQLNATNRKDFVNIDSAGQYSTTPLLAIKVKGKSLGVQLGYEKRIGSGRHQLFYGVDGGFYYSTYDARPSSFLPMQQVRYDLGSFVGLRYRILDRISLSAETSFRVDYNSNVGRDFDKTLISRNKIWGIGFEPLSFFNISYHY